MSKNRRFEVKFISKFGVIWILIDGLLKFGGDASFLICRFFEEFWNSFKSSLEQFLPWNANEILLPFKGFLDKCQDSTRALTIFLSFYDEILGKSIFSNNKLFEFSFPIIFHPIFSVIWFWSHYNFIEIRYCRHLFWRISSNSKKKFFFCS